MPVEEQWIASVADILTTYNKTHVSLTRHRPDLGGQTSLLSISTYLVTIYPYFSAKVDG